MANDQWSAEWTYNEGINETKGLKSFVLNENGEWTGRFQSSDPSKPDIEVNDVHIDSSSHIFDPEKDYVGLIVYLRNGQSEFTLRGVHCKTGDIYIKESNWILTYTPKRSKRVKYVHGRLFYSIFGCWKTKALGFVGAGFSYHDGRLKFNSGTLNTMNPNNNDDTYHDKFRKLHEFEEKLIETVWSHLYENNRWLSRSSDERISLKELFTMEKLPCINLVQIHKNRKLCGRVKWFDRRRGCGFIEAIPDDEAIFVHCSQIQDQLSNAVFPHPGEIVEFNIILGKKGWKAVNVTTAER